MRLVIRVMAAKVAAGGADEGSDEKPACGEGQCGKEDLPDIRGFSVATPSDGGEDEEDEEIAQHERADALPFRYGPRLPARCIVCHGSFGCTAGVETGCSTGFWHGGIVLL